MVQKARARGVHGEIVFPAHHEKFERLIGRPAYREAYKRIGLEGIHFAPETFLDGDYLDVTANSPEAALLKALGKQDLIREYLGVEVDPRGSIELCHTHAPEEKRSQPNTRSRLVSKITGLAESVDLFMERYG